MATGTGLRKYATQNLGMAFEEATAAFLTSRKLGQSGANKMVTSERTLDFYRFDVERFFSYMEKIGHKFYNQITVSNVNSYLEHLTKQDWSDATRKKVLRVLKALFFWVEKDGVCRQEKMKSFRDLLPKIGQAEGKLYIPTPEVLREFLTSIDTSTIWGLRDYVVTCVMIDCGPRIGEICNLNLDGILWNDARLFINKGKTGERLVPLNREVTLPQLKRWIKERERIAQCDALFVGRTGYRCLPNTFSQQYGRHRRRSGMDLSPEGVITCHTVRHFFCTYYLVNGGTLPGLQAITGHTSLSTLQIYMHIARQLTFVKEEHEKASPMKSFLTNTMVKRRLHRT